MGRRKSVLSKACINSCKMYARASTHNLRRCRSEQSPNLLSIGFVRHSRGRSIMVSSIRWNPMLHATSSYRPRRASADLLAAVFGTSAFHSDEHSCGHTGRTSARAALRKGTDTRGVSPATQGKSDAAASLGTVWTPFVQLYKPQTHKTAGLAR